MADSISEKAELKRMNAKPQKNSGRGLYQKGDGVLGPFVVDVKEAQKSFNFNRDVWAKICTDASRHQKDPALMIAIGEGIETVRTWIIGDTMFKLMLEAYQKEYGE